jgi:DeoR/GlpR family transcriptional regulator of sugar metabolism
VLVDLLRSGREGPQGVAGHGAPGLLRQGRAHLRSELAELAGISTETAIRTLSAFKERGYVDLEGHKIYLRDRESLSKIAEPFEIRLKENLI